MNLDQRITEYATLIALVLVLFTLFTSQRASTLNGLDAASTKEPEAKQEVWLDGLLALVTFILFVTGVPLLVDSIKKLHPLAESGPLRGGFTITWLLLIALVFWQLQLWLRARGLLADIQANRPS